MEHTAAQWNAFVTDAWRQGQQESDQQSHMATDGLGAAWQPKQRPEPLIINQGSYQVIRKS